MRGLHRSDHTQRSEAREVARGNNLRMLDSIAPLARAICFLSGCKRIESNFVGAVTNRVKRDLETGAVALDRHLHKRRRIEA